jgi:hypothetical protein
MLRSFRGSRESILTTALNLMYQNPHFGDFKSSSEPMYLRASSVEPAFAAALVCFVGTPSVGELRNLMAALEQRLTPAPDADAAHPTLKAELWWVEGVHETIQGIELPSPRILDEAWANQLFFIGTEPYFADAVESRREDRSWGKLVARKFEAARGSAGDPRLIDRVSFAGAAFIARGANFEYQSAGIDDADVLAQAVNATWVMDLHLLRYSNDPQLRLEPPLSQGSTIDTEVQKRPMSWMEPVMLAVPASTPAEERARRWIEANRAAAHKLGLNGIRSVVFDSGPGAVRGALFGEQVADVERVPFAALESLEIRHLESYPGHWLYAVIMQTRAPVLDASRP